MDSIFFEFYQYFLFVNKTSLRISNKENEKEESCLAATFQYNKGAA